MKPLQKFFSTARQQCYHIIAEVSRAFNRLSMRTQRFCVTAFGLITGSVCMLLIMQALFAQENKHIVHFGLITTVIDTTMKHDTSTDERSLIPVGKLKGEFNGAFEAFYLAVDHEGQLFINRSLQYTAHAYEKSDRWQAITREELKRYEQALHFIPFKGNALKR